MVLPSFYYNQSQEEIIDHYTYLNDNSDLDIMVYNNPNVTSGITRETMKELYKLPHVKIVKDASMVIDVMTGRRRKKCSLWLRLLTISGLCNRCCWMDQYDSKYSS